MARPENGVRVDRLQISGALGPVPKCDLEIRPFTVFIGPQGVGKSLVAQVLYFFEELPYLVQWLVATEAKAARWTADQMVRSLLDRLRSSERPLGFSRTRR